MNKIISTENGGLRKLILVVLHDDEVTTTAGIFRLRLSSNCEVCYVEKYHDGDWYDFTSVNLDSKLRKGKEQEIKSKLLTLWYGEKTDISLLEKTKNWKDFTDEIFSEF